MARVFGLMSDWFGSGKYRMAIPGLALAEVGHEVLLADVPGAPDRDGKTFAAGADVWHGHRVEGREDSILFQGLARMSRTAVLSIDFDDDVWNIDPTNPAHGLHNPERCRRNVEVADVVTVCSDGLAHRVAAWNRNVAVLLNGIPDEVLDLPRQRRHVGVSLGWGGSASHVIDTKILKAVLPRVERVFVMTLLGMPFDVGVPIEVVPWQDTLQNYYAQVDFDIGLAPLSNNVFNFGKSDLKVLEYAARGIPWVASNRGPFVALRAQHEVSGFLVNSDDEWVEALHLLIDDPCLRASMGSAGQDWVRRERTASVLVSAREKAWRIEHKRGHGSFGIFQKDEV